VENDLYFLSREGLRVLGNEPQYFTAIRTNVLSIRIQQNIDAINKTYYSLCNGVYFDNKYIMAVPTAGTSIDRCITYDRRFQAFSVWKNFNAQDMVRYIDSSNNEYLYFLDTTGTQVYARSPGTYSDNGAAIEAWATSKAQDMGNPDLMKFWVDLRILFRRLSGRVTFTVYQDSDVSVGTATIGSASVRGMGLSPMGLVELGLDGETTTTTTVIADDPESIGLNLDSRTIKFKVYNNNPGENFVILGMVYAFYPKSHFVFDSSKKIYL
jgi:hypothetical protein